MLGMAITIAKRGVSAHSGQRGRIAGILWGDPKAGHGASSTSFLSKWDPHVRPNCLHYSYPLQSKGKRGELASKAIFYAQK